MNEAEQLRQSILMDIRSNRDRPKPSRWLPQLERLAQMAPDCPVQLVEDNTVRITIGGITTEYRLRSKPVTTHARKGFYRRGEVPDDSRRAVTLQRVLPRTVEEIEKALELWQPNQAAPRRRSKPKKSKASSGKVELLRAALLEHHRYSTDQLNQTPMSVQQMADAVGVSRSAISSTWLKKLKFENYAVYKRCCEDFRALRIKLQVLAGDVPDELRTNLQAEIERNQAEDE